MQKEELVKYFENLKDDVAPENILNYNKTKLSDHPETEKLTFKRGTIWGAF